MTLDDRRGDIEAAFGELSGEEPEAVEAGVEEAPEPAAEAPQAADIQAEAPQESESAAAARERDDAGRFRAKAAKEAKDAAAKAADTSAPAKAPKSVVPTPSSTQAAKAAPATAPAVKPEAAAPKPPPSWNAVEREAWAGLPPAARAAVLRREKEVTTALNEAAPLRQRDAAWNQVVSPHMAMIQAQGGNPLAVVQNFLQTGAVLHHGSAQQKAQLAADLVRSFNIPVEMLAAALDGQPVPEGQQAQQQFDPRAIAQQVEQQVLQRIEAQRGQATFGRAAAEVESFASGEPEFFEDVRHDMADIMEVAARRGIAMSIEDAYHRAVKLHPDVSQVLQQREAAKRANASLASTQRARAASSSVRTEPVARSAAPREDSRRSDIEDAFDALSGR